MLLTLRDEQNRVVDAIDRIERLRAGLERTSAALDSLAGSDDQDLRDRLTILAARLQALEMSLYDLRLGGGQDTLRWPRQLYAKIASLARYVSGTDFGPTDQAQEVHRGYQQQLQRVEATVAALLERDVATIDAALAALGLPTLESAGSDDPGGGA